MLISLWECRQGAQGILDSASNARLVEEFGTSKEEDVVKFILENGDVQEGEVRFYFPYFTQTVLDCHLCFDRECAN